MSFILFLAVYCIVGLGVFGAFLAITMVFAAKSPNPLKPSEWVSILGISIGFSIIWPVTVLVLILLWIKEFRYGEKE